METLIIVVLIILLIASLSATIIIGWYCRKVINTLSVAAEVSSDFFARLKGYTEHLESIYQLNVFYGDKTIRGLIQHSKEMSGFLKSHLEITSFIQPDILEQIEKIQREEDIKREQDGFREKEN